MPATFGIDDSFGLTPPEVSTIEETSSTQELEAKTIRDDTGTTCQAVPGGVIKTTVTMKGRGTADISLADAGAFVGGTVRVVSVKNSESNDDFPTYEITGTKYESFD